MTQDWDIKSRSIACTACTTAFEDGQAYFSALLTGDIGFERGDFCDDCWKTREAELAPYSSWKGTYRKPPAGPEDPLKKETAETLLRKLMEDEDPQNEGVIYILAVMLERKKTLVEKDVTVDDIGTVHRVYEHRQTGETFLILDPQLKLDQLEGVQTRVIEMLGGPLPRRDSASTASHTDPSNQVNPPDQTDPSDQANPTDPSDPSDSTDDPVEEDEFDDDEDDEFDDDEDDDDDDDDN